MEARFDEVGVHARYIREALERLEAGHQTTSARLGAVETTTASIRMRLEHVEARIPLLTQSEGRLLAKATGMVSAVVGTLYGVWWTVTHWAVVAGVAAGMLPKR